MRLRRCAVLWLEPRELAHFELEGLLSGGTGVVSRMQWFAHAPQLSGPVEVDPDDMLKAALSLAKTSSSLARV